MLCVAEHSPLGPDIQLFLNPLHSPLIQSALPKFAYEYIVGNSTKSLAEIKVNILLIYQSVIPGYCIGQTIFPLAEYLLTAAVNPLFLHMVNDIQSRCSIPLPGIEADCPVVSRVLLSALLKPEVTLAFLQFSGTFAVFHDLANMMETGLSIAPMHVFHHSPWIWQLICSLILLCKGKFLLPEFPGLLGQGSWGPDLVVKAH